MKYKIVEKDNIHAVHSFGYHGDSGKELAQQRIDSGECKKHWSRQDAEFIVVEEN